MAAGRDIEETEPLRIAVLFLAFIIITLLFEKLTHHLETHLKGRARRGLRHAVHHIEEELLALGLISLLLIVAEEYLIEICVSNDDDTSKKKSGYKKARKLLFTRSLMAGGDDSCGEGEEPFWSANTIHQTHIFIFMIAVVHVLYATVSILICLWRMYRWKRFEEQPDRRVKKLQNSRLISGRNAFEYWFWSFWAQFSPSVDESLYLSMRCLFIERMEFPEDYNFLSFVLNTLVEEFAIVVRTDWVMWVIAAVWILSPPFLLVTTAAAVLVVLIAGTKLELVGVKLSQIAFLAYSGDRSGAHVQSITAPNTLIRNSVIHVAKKLNRLSGTPDSEVRPPHLATQSMSVHSQVGGTPKTGGGMRRVQSSEDVKRMSIAKEKRDTWGSDIPQGYEITLTEGTAVHTQPAPGTLSGNVHNNDKGSMHLDAVVEAQPSDKSLSMKETLPDSAKLFWFQRPQLILQALRFVYFETAMAIALVCFDLWQDTDFIIKDIDFFGHRFSTVVIMIGVGVLCLLYTSFSMLPTYALTMVAGSHCPETVLKMAKNLHIEPAQVTRIESLGDKSIQSQMNTLNQPVNHSEKANHEDASSHGGSNEKVIASLIGAMYKGKLQRLASQKQDSSKLTASAPLPDSYSGAAGGSAELRRAGSGFQGGSNADDEDMRGIVAVFGSFEGFLSSLHSAQQGIRRIIPTACFNFDCATASYDGLESTPFDLAAINLTWDLIVAQSNGNLEASV